MASDCNLEPMEHRVHDQSIDDRERALNLFVQEREKEQCQDPRQFRREGCGNRPHLCRYEDVLRSLR